jgi:hypothetical protein
MLEYWGHETIFFEIIVVKGRPHGDFTRHDNDSLCVSLGLNVRGHVQRYTSFLGFLQMQSYQCSNVVGRPVAAKKTDLILITRSRIKPAYQSPLICYGKLRLVDRALGEVFSGLKALRDKPPRRRDLRRPTVPCLRFSEKFHALDSQESA